MLVLRQAYLASQTQKCTYGTKFRDEFTSERAVFVKFAGQLTAGEPALDFACDGSKSRFFRIHEFARCQNLCNSSWKKHASTVRLSISEVGIFKILPDLRDYPQIHM